MRNLDFREGGLDFLQKADELFALGLGEGPQDVGNALEVIGEHGVEDGAALGGEDDVDGAAVAGIGLAGDAGHFGKSGGGGGAVFAVVAFHAEEHEDGEAALADVVAGKEAGNDLENVVAGAQEVEEGVTGAGLEGRASIGGPDEAVVAREVFEH